MACHSCLPTSVYNFNTTGMSGLVCGISAPPVVKNISSCCPTGHWMVKSNCTQYCEVHDQAEFGSCINGDRNAAGNSSSTPAFYDVLCKSANASGTSVNGSGVGGVMESTSQAGRSIAWGYSVLFLALSTIAFSVAPY